MGKILIIDSDYHEREERAPISVECCSMGCLTAENFADAISQLQSEDGIMGAISALNFPGQEGMNGIIRLSNECRKWGIPFQVCISQEDDNPSEDQRKMLERNGIAYEIIETGRKNWEKSVERILGPR
ncbi:MAG: hypothetical protein KKB82_08190 [Candidatus Omnitrophica bacterium]|nr:hypothetical protein [Candidatus Omnitrophota bacterium]MBU1925882.1 hypothetical protein [Candidatus Omnitrophota bacterium]MBU2028375.1 hypothetical protein [Patescibacteria group bacterium]